LKKQSHILVAVIMTIFLAVSIFGAILNLSNCLQLREKVRKHVSMGFKICPICGDVADTPVHYSGSGGHEDLWYCKRHTKHSPYMLRGPASRFPGGFHISSWLDVTASLWLLLGMAVSVGCVLFSLIFLYYALTSDKEGNRDEPAIFVILLAVIFPIFSLIMGFSLQGNDWL